MPFSEPTNVSFSNFLVSLASSAMLHLGEAPDPVTRQAATDLPLARHTIDILGMLREKTKGNLDDDEGRLLETLVFDLRSKYVEAVRRQG